MTAQNTRDTTSPGLEHGWELSPFVKTEIACFEICFGSFSTANFGAKIPFTCCYRSTNEALLNERASKHFHAGSFDRVTKASAHDKVVLITRTNLG